MINFGNIRLSRFFVGSDSIQTILSGVTTLHGDYDDSNKSLTTITCSTPSGRIDTDFSLSASADSNVELTYSSSDTSIATVDASGTVSPLASGTTTITITASGTTVGNTTYRGAQKRLEVECDAPAPTPAWDDDFLTIEALNASTRVDLINPGYINIWYRKDNETEYTKIPTGDTSITIENPNGCIKLYGDNEGVGTYSNSTSFRIYCQNNCNCYGKVTSLLSSGCPETIDSTYTFSCLFYGSSIVDASGLILPNNVTGNCYDSMFYGNKNLITPPSVLPATEVAVNAYGSMFYGCTNLTQSPQLSATTLERYCYQNMFRDCSNLSTVTLCYTGSAPSTSQGYFYNWLKNAGGTGCTIYAPAKALWNASTSTMYIPSNWTVEKIL